MKYYSSFNRIKKVHFFVTIHILSQFPPYVEIPTFVTRARTGAQAGLISSFLLPLLLERLQTSVNFQSDYCVENNSCLHLFLCKIISPCSCFFMEILSSSFLGWSHETIYMSNTCSNPLQSPSLSSDFDWITLIFLKICLTDYFLRSSWASTSLNVIKYNH